MVFTFAHLDIVPKNYNVAHGIYLSCQLVANESILCIMLNFCMVSLNKF